MPTALEGVALEEETESGSSESMHLVQRRYGLEVVAGENTSESGDGFERVLATLPIRSRANWSRRR